MEKLKNLSKNLSLGLSIKDQIFFAKRLSFLIKANVPILESLHMIKDQTRSKKQNKIMAKVAESVANGQSLSSSLGKFRRVFGEFAINIISVGESSGILSENLNYLSEELKKRQILRRKVVGAFVYPAFVTVATLGITLLLTVYIFPKIMPIFTSLHVDLPLSTRVLIFMSQVLQEWGFYIFLFLVFLFIAFFITLKESERVHLFFDKLILKLPFLGDMVRNYNLANLSRTLGLLLKSGLTLSEALPIARDTTTNMVYKEELDKLLNVVSRGEKISSHLQKNNKIFPDIFSQIISVGERSGNLAETCVYISELYEAEVEDSTKNIGSLIEPVLMVCMGLVVGFVAISVITPIYGITQHLSPR